MVIFIFLILLAIFGGAIYLFLRAQRKKELSRRMRLQALADEENASGKNIVTATPVNPDSATADGTATANAAPGTTNASPGATSASAGTESNGPATQSPAPAPPPKAVLGATESGKISDTLRAQMQALAAARNSAASEQAAFKLAEREWRWHRPSGDSPGAQDETDPAAFVERHASTARKYLQETNRLESCRSDMVRTTTAARSAWTTLAESLRRLNRYELDDLPADLRALRLTADLLHGFYKESIEKMSDFAAQNSKALVKPRPAPPAPGKYAAALKELAAALEPLVVTYAQCYSMRISASAAFESLSRLDKKQFTDPQKPTEEEVGRFIRELEGWSEERLPIERSAARWLAALKEKLPAHKAALDLATAKYGALSSLMKKQLPEGDEAALSGAKLIIDAALNFFTISATYVADWAKVGATATPPVAGSRAEEAQTIANLRKMFRTFGYALAQKSVAEAKSKHAQGKVILPIPSPGTVVFGTNEGDVEAGIKSFERYVTEKAARDIEIEKIEAEREVTENAAEARQAKVLSAARGLDAACTTISNDLTLESTDELRVLLGTAKKMFLRTQEQPENEKDENK